jgi:hypothetical protein
MSSITKDSSGAGSLVRYKVKVVLTPPTPRSQTPSQPVAPRAVTVGGLP